MRPLLTALPLALSLALTSPTFAETREDRLAIANEYVANSMQDMDMEAMIRTMWEPLVDQITASGQEVSDEQRSQIGTLYMDTFSEPMRTLLEGQGEVMADLFTMAELEKLRDFYATPEGRAIMQKMPEVMQAIQPEIMTLVQSTLPTLMPKLMEIVQPQQ